MGTDFRNNMSKEELDRYELWLKEGDKLREEIAERNKSIPKDQFLDLWKRRRSCL